MAISHSSSLISRQHNDQPFVTISFDDFPPRTVIEVKHIKMLKTRFLCAMFMVMKVLEGTKGCCMFDQWEGVTVSVEREFDAVQGAVYERVTTERHYYDFINSRVASRDVQTGKFTLKDFKEGIAIVPKGNSCLKIPINENMARSCLPKDATFLGKHFIGVDVPVSLWTANNHTSHLVVLQNTCIPVSEETFQTNGPHSLVIFTYFYNVTLGIKHEEVFSVPDSCSEPDQDEIDFVNKINEHLDMKKKSFTV